MTEGRGLSIFEDEPEDTGESQRQETAADDPTVVIPVGARNTPRGAPSAADDTSSGQRRDATRTQAIPVAKAEEADKPPAKGAETEHPPAPLGQSVDEVLQVTEKVSPLLGCGDGLREPLQDRGVHCRVDLTPGCSPIHQAVSFHRAKQPFFRIQDSLPLVQQGEEGLLEDVLRVLTGDTVIREKPFQLGFDCLQEILEGGGVLGWGRAEHSDQKKKKCCNPNLTPFSRAVQLIDVSA